MMIRLARFWPLMVAAWAGCASGEGQGHVVLTGLVDATEIDVASKVPGRVRNLAVREGDTVQAGQKLLDIESFEVKAKIDQVNAAIDATRAKLSMARHGARIEEKRAARNALNAARHQVDVTRSMLDRSKPLFEAKAISQARWEEIEFRYNLAMDQFAMAQARLDMVLNGARDEEVDALEAMVRQGEGNLREVQAYDRETEQVAPIAGEVAKVVLHEGELAGTGAPIVTIVDMSDTWASFAVREDLLGRVRKDSEIEVVIPALGRSVLMRVFLISVMGDFATWRATSAKDTFDLKTFEVRARPISPVEGLRPGMTVRWTIPEA